MKRRSKNELNFVIDKLTNSIQNTISGDSFETVVHRFLSIDVRKVGRRNGWQFDWKAELKDNRYDVFKLVISNSDEVIQGLISLEQRTDHVFINLLENAPFNIGSKKVYKGVAANLIAYACKISLNMGCNGNVSFFAKTKLIEHYIEKLGATWLGGQRMAITDQSASRLIENYFNKK